MDPTREKEGIARGVPLGPGSSDEGCGGSTRSQWEEQRCIPVTGMLGDQGAVAMVNGVPIGEGSVGRAHVSIPACLGGARSSLGFLFS